MSWAARVCRGPRCKTNAVEEERWDRANTNAWASAGGEGRLARSSSNVKIHGRRFAQRRQAVVTNIKHCGRTHRNDGLRPIFLSHSPHGRGFPSQTPKRDVPPPPPQDARPHLPARCPHAVKRRHDSRSILPGRIILLLACPQNNAGLLVRLKLANAPAGWRGATRLHLCIDWGMDQAFD